jgi:uncharacterized metal-binding protein
MHGAVAVWFIYGYSKFLNTRQPLHTPLLDSTMKLGVLLVAWLLCFVTILGIAYVL